jgi:hypothetical protein
LEDSFQTRTAFAILQNEKEMSCSFHSLAVEPVIVSWSSLV